MRKEQHINKFLLAIFNEEQTLLNAAHAAGKNSIVLYDVYTPYVVHGLDDAMGIKRSRLPIVCFIAGLLGFMLGLGFQLWTFSESWPLIVGGKPFHAIPAFIPVTFELTVLVGGLVTVAAFLVRSKLYPGATPLLPEKLVTDHLFVIAVAKNDASLNDKAVSQFFLEHGAIEIRESEERS